MSNIPYVVSVDLRDDAETRIRPWGPNVQAGLFALSPGVPGASPDHHRMLWRLAPRTSFFFFGGYY